MSIKADLTAAMKDAMRAKQSVRLITIRMAITAIKNKEIDAKAELDEAAEIAVLSTMAKQRREAAVAYREGDRLELAEKEEAELLLIQEFLPKQLSDDEVREIVKAAVAESGATSAKDMGKVMPLVIAKTAGKCDSKMVSGLVKELLS